MQANNDSAGRAQGQEGPSGEDVIRGLQAISPMLGPLGPLFGGALEGFKNLGDLSGPPRNQRDNQGPESGRDPVQRAALGAPSGDESAAAEQLAPETDIAGVRGRRRRIGLLAEQESPAVRRRLIGV